MALTSRNGSFEVSGSADEKLEAIWEKILASHDVAAPLLWQKFAFISDGCSCNVSAIFWWSGLKTVFWGGSFCEDFAVGDAR